MSPFVSHKGSPARQISGRCRTRPSFGIVTWPFYSGRATVICRLARSTSTSDHASAIISPAPQARFST